MVEEINVTNEQLQEKISHRSEVGLPDQTFERSIQYRWDSRDEVDTRNGSMNLAIERGSSDAFAFISNDHENLRRLNGGGEETWVGKNRERGIRQGTIATNGEYIAIGYNNGEVEILDANKFTQVAFRENLSDDIRSIEITPDDRVYIGDRDNDRIIQADLDLANLDLDVKITTSTNNDPYGLAVEDDTGDFYVGTSRDTVRKYTSDGTQVWEKSDIFNNTVRSIAYNDEISGTSVNQLYVCGDDRDVFRLNTDDGSEVWRISNTGNVEDRDIRALTVGSNDFIYAGNTRGQIYRIDPSDGSFDDFDSSPDRNRQVNDIISNPQDSTQAFVVYSDGQDQLKRVDVDSSTINKVYDFDDDRSREGIVKFTNSSGELRIVTHPDRSRMLYHEPVDLVPVRGPEIYGRSGFNDITYIPSTQNYMISQDRSGIMFRDAVTGNLERVFHENGDRRNQIDRDERYRRLYGPFNGKVYIEMRDNRLRVYDVSTQSIVDTKHRPFTVSSKHIKQDSSGNVVFVLRDGNINDRDADRLFRFDESFNRVYSRRINQLTQVFTDGDNEYTVVNNRILQKRDPNNGDVLKTEMYSNKLGNIKGSFAGKLVISDGSTPHLINKSDLSYHAPFPRRPGYDDIDQPVFHESSNRILFRLSNPRNIFIQQIDYNPTARDTRALYRANIMGRDIHINGFRVNNGLSDSRGDNMPNDQITSVDAYLLSDTFIATNSSDGYIDAVKIDEGTT